MIQKDTSVALLRAIRRTYRNKSNRRIVLRGIASPFFPLTFFIRNISALQREKGWKSLTLSMQKAQVSRMLLERTRFFLEVKEWLEQKQNRQPGKHFIPNDPRFISPDEYCTHCGECCEIASGFPDFSKDTPLPRKWQEVFGQGLGKGHRFCAFLWEIRGKGVSLCAIHPWRSLPCRVFEREECEFLKNEEYDLEIGDEVVVLNMSAVRCRS